MWLYLLCCLTPGALCVCLPLRWLLKQEWPQLRRMLYFPIAGQSRWEHRTQRTRLLRRLGGKELVLRTDDDRRVHCVWIEHPGSRGASPDIKSTSAPGAAQSSGGADDPPIETPVVLLLHANAMVLDDMIDWAHYYLSLGCSVMLVTFWGYPDPEDEEGGSDLRSPSPTAAQSDSASLLGGDGSDDGLADRTPTEATMYLDAEAALRYVQQVRRAPVERTLAHGLSIGGACAASLGVRHPGLRVTLDQTFASLSEVSMHVGTGLYDQLVLTKSPRSLVKPLKCCKPLLLRMAVAILVRMLFKTRAHNTKHALCAPDRMDNLSKAAQIKGDVFAIFSEHDEMMPPDIATRLLAARYGRSATPELMRSRVMCVPGGHCSFFGEFPDLAQHYHKYLVSSGFLEIGMLASMHARPPPRS